MLMLSIGRVDAVATMAISAAADTQATVTSDITTNVGIAAVTAVVMVAAVVGSTPTMAVAQ